MKYYKNRIVKNIVYSLVEKIFIVACQFIASIAIVRLLRREDYGIIGVVAGFYTFMHLINISIDSIIFRDHKLYKNELNKVFYNFFIFNVFKVIVFIILGSLISIFMSKIYDSRLFVYAITSITAIYAYESFIAPFSIYASSNFEQKDVARINICKQFCNVILLLGLCWYPSLKFIAIKDLIISFCFLIVWFFWMKKRFNVGFLKVNFLKDFDLKFILDTITDYSLWTHLSGVVTNFIYRSDTFFLSFFYNLSIVGNYNIALNGANIANILPSLLGYQNSVALSNVEQDKNLYKSSNAFIRASLYIGIVTFFMFLLFGRIYVYILTGQKEEKIFLNLMFIVSSLIIVKSFASPLISFINIKGSVKKLFINVLVPTGLSTALIYYFASKYYGSTVVAFSNIIIAIIWLVLLVVEVKKYKYDFSDIFNFRSDYVLLKEMLEKINDKFRKPE